MDSQHSSPSSSTTAPRSLPVPSPTAYRPRIFEAMCTHLTMGWLYRCTQDRESLIIDALQSDQPINFDSIGIMLSNEIKPGPRSPERRADKLNFFREITDEQMKTYSPSQIATILEQRENLSRVIAQQHQASYKARRLYYPSGSNLAGLSRPLPGLGFTSETKPWVPARARECQAMYCHNCRPSCEARSYLSLDGVLQGDVPATACTGFGFHRVGRRPVVDARLIKDIGLRPVPWPRACQRSQSTPSTWSLSDITEDEIIEPDDGEMELDSGSRGGSTLDSTRAVRSGFSIFQEPRPPFTPPPTPTSWTGISRYENGTTTFEYSPYVCDGRSVSSLKTNGLVRRHVVRSMAGLIHKKSDEGEVKESQIVGESSDQKTVTPMMAEELQEGHFHPGPLEVARGVAVLEESVEIGVPDVITQT